MLQCPDCKPNLEQKNTVQNYIMVLAIILMRKSINYKALYNFNKQGKLRNSSSTKDHEDSLDCGTPQIPLSKAGKRTHLRTQSCPQPPQPLTPVKSALSRSKAKPKSPLYHSQTSLDSLSQSQQSLSVESLSIALYRKQSKEGGLRKVGAVSRGLLVNQQQFSRSRQQNQMKSYQLSKELAELQRSKKNTHIKQQILNSLLDKVESNSPYPPLQL